MAFLQDKIYPRLPVFAQNWAISAYGYYWQKRRFGGIFKEELKKFKDREAFTAQQWRDYQTVELRKLLVHAFETVPFYREKYSKLGFTVSQLGRFELEDLKKLPFLEKQDLRKFGTTTLLSSKREKGGQFFSSSGSTGTPTQILYSEPLHQKWTAGYESRVKNWANVSMHDVRGMIGGRRIIPEAFGKAPFYRWNPFERQVYFSAYHISPNTITSYLEGMNKHKVDYMMGYAMSNYFLAKLLVESGYPLPKLKSVITSSEKLTLEMRSIFRKAYQCPTYDTWSSVEMCGQISECGKGGLHISPDIGIIEFTSFDNNNINESSEKEIICTGLLNFDQPLIRYKIGDTAIISLDKCRCGREMPMVKEIGGRIEDTVIGKDGRMMVRFHSIFIDIPKIMEAQVIQHTLDEFEILASVTTPMDSSEKEIIKNRMMSQLGQINISIKEVSKIERGGNGKFKAVISKVNL